MLKFRNIDIFFRWYCETKSSGESREPKRCSIISLSVQYRSVIMQSFAPVQFQLFEAFSKDILIQQLIWKISGTNDRPFLSLVFLSSTGCTDKGARKLLCDLQTRPGWCQRIWDNSFTSKIVFYLFIFLRFEFGNNAEIVILARKINVFKYIITFFSPAAGYDHKKCV